MTTKEQEKKALEQIRKIVAGLGEDSYIATAFEGCFEIAEENIENDFACSMKQNAEHYMELYENLQDEYYTLKASADEAARNFESKIKWAEGQLDSFKSRCESAEKGNEKWYNKYNEEYERVSKATGEIEKLNLEIMKLKAELYDFMVKK